MIILIYITLKMQYSFHVFFFHFPFQTLPIYLSFYFIDTLILFIPPTEIFISYHTHSILPFPHPEILLLSSLEPLKDNYHKFSVIWDTF